MKKNYEKVDLSKGYYNFKNIDPALYENTGRYKSWNIIYDLTSKYIKEENYDYDLYTLNLCMYLASWGMYRGSTKLLQRFNYRALIPVSKIILKKKYHSLHNLTSVKDFFDEKGNIIFSVINLICELAEEIKIELEKIFKNTPDFTRFNKKTNEKKIIETSGVTDTLITKIMLGSYGCIVAYDKYVKAELKHINIFADIKNSKNEFDLEKFKKSLEDILNYIYAEIEYFESKSDGYYPIMKIFDMSLFGINNK